MTARQVMLAQWQRWQGSEAALVGYWPFDGNAEDLGPHRLHGEVRGSPTFVPAFAKPLNDVSSLEA